MIISADLIKSGDFKLIVVDHFEKHRAADRSLVAITYLL